MTYWKNTEELDKKVVVEIHSIHNNPNLNDNDRFQIF